MGLPEKKTDLRVMTSVNFSLHSDQMSQGGLKTAICLELLSVVKYLEGHDILAEKKDLACTATMMGVRPSTSLVSRQSLLQLGWANNLPSNHCLVGLLSFSGRALALLKRIMVCMFQY